MNQHLVRNFEHAGKRNFCHKDGSGQEREPPYQDQDDNSEGNSYS